MTRYFVAVLAIMVGGLLKAEEPTFSFNIDAQFPSTPFEVEAFAGSTPIIQCNLLTNGSPYTSLASGYTASMVYAYSDRDAYMATITGTLTVATGVILFNCTTSAFPSPGDYYAQIILVKGSTLYVWSQGALDVLNSPGSGSYGNLDLKPRINWDIVENYGSLPWATSSVPVEAAARIAADAALTTAVLQAGADFTNEVVARKASDAALTNSMLTAGINITNEIANRIGTGAALSNEIALLGNITNETAERRDADKALTNSTLALGIGLTNEIANRVAGDAAVTTALWVAGLAATNEAAARIAADAASTTAVLVAGVSITNEQTARLVTGISITNLIASDAASTAAVLSVGLNLTNETANRVASDAALSNELATLGSVTNEAAIRRDADLALTNSVLALGVGLTNEITARVASDAALTTAVWVAGLAATNEAAARIGGDAAITTALWVAGLAATNETVARIAADAASTAAVKAAGLLFTNEVANRVASDAALTTALWAAGADITNHYAADAALTTIVLQAGTDLTNETANRLAGDAGNSNQALALGVSLSNNYMTQTILSNTFYLRNNPSNFYLASNPSNFYLSSNPSNWAAAASLLALSNAIPNLSTLSNGVAVAVTDAVVVGQSGTGSVAISGQRIQLTYPTGGGFTNPLDENIDFGGFSGTNIATLIVTNHGLTSVRIGYPGVGPKGILEIGSVYAKGMYTNLILHVASNLPAAGDGAFIAIQTRANIAGLLGGLRWTDDGNGNSKLSLGNVIPSVYNESCYVDYDGGFVVTNKSLRGMSYISYLGPLNLQGGALTNVEVYVTNTATAVRSAGRVATIANEPGKLQSGGALYDFAEGTATNVGNLYITNGLPTTSKVAVPDAAGKVSWGYPQSIGWSLTVGTARQITNSTWQTIGYDTIVKSNMVTFSAANFSVVPLIAGWYGINANPKIDGVTAAGSVINITINKNASSVKYYTRPVRAGTAGTFGERLDVSGYVYCDGDDVITINMYSLTGSIATNTTDGYSFDGFLIGQ